MTVVAAAGTALTVVGTGGLLVAVRRAPLRQHVPKMVASSGFLLVAFGGSALGTGFGRLVLLGLALSWFGDLFLLGDGRSAFLAGLSAFLVAHVAYSLAFGARGIDVATAAIAAVFLGSIAVAVSRWLLPHVPEGLRGPVVAYVVVITAMTVLSFGSAGSSPDLRIPIGATAFFLSDLFVAREQFIARAVANRLWGLPLYYVGQVLLALAAGG